MTVDCRDSHTMYMYIYMYHGASLYCMCARQNGANVCIHVNDACIYIVLWHCRY